jgi:hypothetical protein
MEDRDQFILRIEWDSADGHMKGFRTEPEFQPFLKDAPLRDYVGPVAPVRASS